MTARKNQRMRPGLVTPAALSGYRQLVERSYRRYSTPLRQWLRQCYPRADHGLVEDAVADSFVHVLERPDAFARAMEDGGESALLRLIAWRNLRGHFRKKARQCERTDVDAVEQPGALTPHQIVSGRQTVTRVCELIDAAAVRFGGSRSEALRTALHDRLAGGTDTEAARAHGLPREYVNRAKRWLGTQLHAA